MSGLSVKEEMAVPGLGREVSGSLEQKVMRLPELLAPAGDWDCAKAAVENGADAIYFGLEKFNARMRARNFTESICLRCSSSCTAAASKGTLPLTR
jgi:hypothetical protein